MDVIASELCLPYQVDVYAATFDVIKHAVLQHH
jgi:hypothetical protein